MPPKLVNFDNAFKTITQHNYGMAMSKAKQIRPGRVFDAIQKLYVFNLAKYSRVVKNLLCCNKDVENCQSTSMQVIAVMLWVLRLRSVNRPP